MTVDFKEYSRRMDKALEHLDEEFASVRAGRANAKVLDRITVEYYGSETPLNGVATISAPDARTLIIQPWDTKLLKDIQKAIQTSDLGINPSNDGKVIRLVVPELNEERRKELTEQLAARLETESSVDAWLDMMQDYAQLEELDRPTLVRLIQKIEISERYPVDDHKERDIHIYYNFVGYIEA